MCVYILLRGQCQWTVFSKWNIKAEAIWSERQEIKKIWGPISIFLTFMCSVLFRLRQRGKVYVFCSYPKSLMRGLGVGTTTLSHQGEEKQVSELDTFSNRRKPQLPHPCGFVWAPGAESALGVSYGTCPRRATTAVYHRREKNNCFSLEHL